ncbi:hypothetical protein LTR92_011455 [Exophiala xenobiotica]|nr:hypothetical protein LTR92_011455 [Exophiala xenobiotica]KAK5399165.1 hypothetical protein LTR06_011504 [Exophiala xenobiotica]
MAQFDVAGNTQGRIIQAAVVFHLVDPVRGEPTAYDLDREFNDIERRENRQLKCKFLDSFTLSHNKEDDDTVSVASFEAGLPGGKLFVSRAITV